MIFLKKLFFTHPSAFIIIHKLNSSFFSFLGKFTDDQVQFLNWESNKKNNFDCSPPGEFLPLGLGGASFPKIYLLLTFQKKHMWNLIFQLKIIKKLIGSLNNNLK